MAPEFAPSALPLREIVGFAVPNGVGDVDAARLASLGVRWIRRDLYWHVVEPARGQRDFSAYEPAVDAALAAGVRTLPILAYGDPWAAAGAGPEDLHVPPDDPADFAAFAGAAAARFRGRMPAYEIWNEPNLGFRFWQPREDAVAYGASLGAASGAIRAADPDATIVLGGLIYHPVLTVGAEVFLEDLYFYHPDIGRAFDVLGFHPYALYPPRVAPELDDPATGEMNAARMVARMRAIVRWYGDGATKPIWVTEVGWPVFSATVGATDEEHQARWFMRSLLLLAGAGCDRVFWFTLHDGPAWDRYPPEDAFGLWRWDDPADGWDPAPKPAWQALVTLLEVAGGLAVAEDVSGALAGAPADA